MSAAHHAMVKRIRSEYDFDLHAWKCEGNWEAQAEAWKKGTGNRVGGRKNIFTNEISGGVISHHGVERLGVGESYNSDTQSEARTVAVFRLAQQLFGKDAVAEEFEAALQRLRDASDAEFNVRCGL